MIEIENVGVWWTSQLFTIASFDSRLLPALVYFQLLPLLAFFRPILPPQVYVSLTLPRYFFLTPICVGCLCHLLSSLSASELLLQHCVLSSCAIHCNSSWSKWWATISEILLSCFSLQVEHPQRLAGTSACFLHWMHGPQVREGIRVPFACSQERIVLQASPKGCLSLRFLPTNSFFCLFVLKRLLT